MKRILFVDDERQVLDGLRALLRPQRDRWEMVFVDSGERGLAELASSTFDVVVSDMKMPGMDGATLLRTAEKRHPDVVRIVLSGFAEFETALRTVPVGHQFLVKPCEEAVLVNVIERACDLQAVVRDPAAVEQAGPRDRLPTLPRTYLELTQVLAREQAGLAQVARVVEDDPGIAARVLQLVNSAFLGLGREIVSIEQAVAYLGTNMLKNLVLAAQVFGTDRGSVDGLWLHRAERHALLVGTIARQIAGNDKRTAEDAFIAGVLHDIGKLVLMTRDPDGATSIAAESRATGRPGFQLEKERYGVTHAEVGGHLLNVWGLPYPVIEAAANHHSPRRVSQLPGVDVLTAVYAANGLAHEQLRTANADDEPFAPVDEAFLEGLGVSDRLRRWRDIARSCVGASRASHWTADPGAAAA